MLSDTGCQTTDTNKLDELFSRSQKHELNTILLFSMRYFA